MRRRNLYSISRNISLQKWAVESALYIFDGNVSKDINILIFALFADNPKDAEKLLHSLEVSAANIGLHVNSKKTEYMTLNTDGAIKSLNQTPLKKVEEFNYLGRNIS